MCHTRAPLSEFPPLAPLFQDTERVLGGAGKPSVSLSAICPPLSRILSASTATVVRETHWSEQGERVCEKKMHRYRGPLRTAICTKTGPLKAFCCTSLGSLDIVQARLTHTNNEGMFHAKIRTKERRKRADAERLTKKMERMLMQMEHDGSE